MNGPVILFATGVGAPSTSSWMQAWRERLSTLGRVVTFDYPYMLAGRRRPDSPAHLIEAHTQALERARETAEGPLILAGKSMGGRIGCHVAKSESVAALVCFGYPLCSPSGKRRDEILLTLDSPLLFIQGTRDALCPLDLLEDVRRRMTAPTALHLVEGGDHSLQVTRTALKQAGLTQETIDLQILRAIDDFIRARIRAA
jgi:uncharacterized protein